MTKTPEPKQLSLFSDQWHRPHANHKDQEPTVDLDRGPYGLSVTLDTWGPEKNILSTIYAEAQSNWGERPLRNLTDEEMTPSQLKVVQHILDGKHLQNVLEVLSFAFTVEGCTRACTHELVRTRVGASFAQHGGRDNDWRHRKWSIPEALFQAIECERFGEPAKQGAVDPYVLQQKFAEYLGESGAADIPLLDVLEMVLKVQKAFYAASVDAGLSWQDARRILGIGHQTYIHANYNYVALRGVLAHRLEHGAVDWEIDCVAQLMVREVWLKCPRILAKPLCSHSDKAKVNKFATLYSWPPNGKWPTPADFDPGIPNTFQRRQAPFWILDPRCLVDANRLVEWIPTEGTFPWDEYNKRADEVRAELERAI